MHLLVKYPPKISVSKLVNSLKGAPSRLVQKKRHPSLWPSSYFRRDMQRKAIRFDSTYRTARIASGLKARFIPILKGWVFLCPWIKLLFLLFFFACTNSAYRGKDVLGAEEFVLDSYQILEDKAQQDKIAYSIKNIHPQKNIAICADKLHLLEVLSLIPKKVNLSKSYLIRNSQLLPIDLYDLIENQNMKQNIVLKRGDKIYIMENSYLMMLGDVTRECLIDIPNGFIPLKQALVHTEGILSFGNRAYIQIIRGGILHPKIYIVDLRYVMNLPEYSMLLVPGDIVCLTTKLMTGWGFTANELPPNFIAFDLLRKKAFLEVTIE